MRARRSLLLGILLLAGCGKVSSDFRKTGNEARDALRAWQGTRMASLAEAENSRIPLKEKLEAVTNVTKSENERNAQAVLVSAFVQIATLKQAELLPLSESTAGEVKRLQEKSGECLKEYDALAGNTRDSALENGPCLQEAKAAMKQ